MPVVIMNKIPLLIKLREVSEIQNMKKKNKNKNRNGFNNKNRDQLKEII